MRGIRIPDVSGNFVPFRRFFTKVLLSSMCGVPSKHVVDISTRRLKDALSRPACM